MKQAERSGGACQPIQGDTIARTYPNTTDSSSFDGTSTGPSQRRDPSVVGASRRMNCGVLAVLCSRRRSSLHYNQHKLGKPQILCFRILFITVFQGI